MRVAFYAPLKPPTHATPSGDRRMARLLISALETAEHKVGLASDFRSYEGRGRPDFQNALAAAARVEVDHILETYNFARPEARPEIWFTYHLYYKAPDYLGPPIARAMNIPYVVAEPSFAPKRAGGPWDTGHRAVAEALQQADAVLCLTRHDMDCIAPLVTPLTIPGGEDLDRLFHLPPFLEATPYGLSAAQRADQRQSLATRFGVDPDKTWLMAVGMMRPGDKLESYRRLSHALHYLTDENWQLLTVGAGAAQDDVEAALAPLGAGRVRHLGAIDPDHLPGLLAAADIFVWPAAGEAYGMAMLEAQASAVPVVAGEVRGVPEVVRDGETALLVAENEPSLFADAVRQLIKDTARRTRMGKAARHFVQTERSVAKAGDILNTALASARTSHRIRAEISEAKY